MGKAEDLTGCIFGDGMIKVLRRAENNDVESLLERHTKITSSFCRKSQMCIGVRLKPRLCCHASSVFM